ncbi:unnamed protein product [Amoebophrya sp. A25]|nr:unnamed protein product [Amoebophrya sp. A25]|eukprot:GSA25T00001871001.1
MTFRVGDAFESQLTRTKILSPTTPFASRVAEPLLCMSEGAGRDPENGGLLPTMGIAADANRRPAPFSVPGLAWYADCYVAMHAFFALSFASVALFLPEMFSLFCNMEIPADSVAADCIRWSSPFIFGFGFLAITSLYLDVQARTYIARVYVASFVIAVCSGCRAQSTGRWNSLHPLNIAIFASLAVGYLVLLVSFPHALDRANAKRP